MLHNIRGFREQRKTRLDHNSANYENGNIVAEEQSS